METIHAEETPLAEYLEGEGYLDQAYNGNHDEPELPIAPVCEGDDRSSFAPPHNIIKANKLRRAHLPPLRTKPTPETQLSRAYNAWSSAVNSHLQRVDNEKFMEHFRYIIVASQLLHEYLDQGSLQPAVIAQGGQEGANHTSATSPATSDTYGAVAAAAIAFALVYIIHWSRSRRDSFVSWTRVALALAVFIAVALVGYAYVRRQWLKSIRQNAVAAASTLTTNWQALEVATSNALSLVQEVELVSKGFRLSIPLPPVSRIEEQGGPRRCARLRKALHRTYASVIPACIEASRTLRGLVEEDNLEKYLEIYDISSQDAKEASGEHALQVLDDDAESLKSLRVLSFRAGILRRVTLSSLMALEADGGKPDFHRWRTATEAILELSKLVGSLADKLRQVLSEMETVPPLQSPVAKMGHAPAREKMRSQVRKISMLSSGIRGLQAKMQILREETNKAIEQSEDLTDVGPSLMVQYESIGSDLKELMQTWEAGKATLQSNITKQEHRISMASSASGLRSPLSSISGLTAVSESGTPADALKALNGDSMSDRSSMATTPSDEEQIFEAIGMPKQRSTLTREERILKMQEERERQASLRAKRESNTHMLRELESVINLRPKPKGAARITSI
ncbi:Mysoin-binding motif of peroxisomes [Teratosphaeria destructans]|uniref:Vezatin n=1 Tax=Teratosphaeria destructans TaxID=418781 RepID=A0A9W7SHY6_9PEZI|nr:Mysoin-binding motif of peroxisomes [Teratosphaeria destructans]